MIRAMTEPIENLLLARFRALPAAAPLLARLGDAEGVYLVDRITDERSGPIAQLLLLEVMEEDSRRIDRKSVV